MTRDEFKKLDDELLAAANKTLDGRRSAYAGDGDVLMNFKQVARETGIPMSKVWEVYFCKALNALRAVVEGGEGGGESRIERAVDALNYVRLGWAIAQENRPVVEERRETLEEFMRREQAVGPRFQLTDGLMAPGRARNRFAD